jgi:hypothetical protein
LKPEDVFAIHPAIRWVGLATRKGRVIFSQMKEGVSSITPDTNDLSTLEIRTQYIIEGAEQESRWAGALDRITFVFEKYVEVIVPLRDSYVAVTVDKEILPQSYSGISKAIRELEKPTPQ